MIAANARQFEVAFEMITYTSIQSGPDVQSGFACV